MAPLRTYAKRHHGMHAPDAIFSPFTAPSRFRTQGLLRSQLWAEQLSVYTCQIYKEVIILFGEVQCWQIGSGHREFGSGR